MNNKISVIIPIYNVELYLERCLKSVINNTYQNLEIICINDGSTDNSLQILEEYQKKDNRIQIINQKNGGLSVARNVGLEIATGQYIAFIDSDDWIHHLYFEILLYYLKKMKADVVVCREKQTYTAEEDEKILVGHSKTKLLNLKEIINDKNAKTMVWGRIYTKELIGNHRFVPGMLLEDTPFNLDVFSHFEHIRCALVDERLYYYYMRETSIMHTLSNKSYFEKTKYYYSFIWKAENKNIRRLYISETIKAAMAYRYLDGFNPNNKAEMQECKKILKNCLEEIRKLKNISVSEVLKYHILSLLPVTYRIFRIINDPTMLKWERTEKRKYKKSKTKTINI